MKRREFIALLGSAAISSVSWPLAAHAQQMMTIGYFSSQSSAWDAALRNGAMREEVAGRLVNSVEGHQRLVQVFYGQFLGRAADAFGLDQFVNALERLDRDVHGLGIAARREPSPERRGGHRDQRRDADDPARPAQRRHRIGRAQTLDVEGQAHEHE